MKLADLLNEHKYKIKDNIDDNLMKFILNLDLKIDEVNTKQAEIKPRKTKSKVTFLEKFSKHKKGDAERDFIIDILENDSKYRAYKDTYLYWVNLNIKDYTKERIKDILDPYDIDLYLITDGQVSESDIDEGIKDIDMMIDIFKEKLLPPIDIDAVHEELSDIFEHVVGEKRGFLRDLDGKWYKFGNDAYRDCKLLGIKYPGFGEAMQNENLRNHFIHFLTYGADECLYTYNEKEIIKGWY